jgi:hypothetical protein
MLDVNRDIEDGVSAFKLGSRHGGEWECEGTATRILNLGTRWERMTSFMFRQIYLEANWIEDG